jgi:hypothetical protein
MHVLRIEHSVSDYDEWKKAFDADPLGRKGSGVTRYRILRATDDPNRVMIDLDFNSSEEADRMHGALRELWTRIDVIIAPQAHTAQVVESGEY